MIERERECVGRVGLLRGKRERNERGVIASWRSSMKEKKEESSCCLLFVVGVGSSKMNEL